MVAEAVEAAAVGEPCHHPDVLFVLDSEVTIRRWLKEQIRDF